MSEMALFKGGIPEHLRNAELDEATKALMGAKKSNGGTGGSKRISIKAGVFRMMVDGKEVAQNEDRAMPVIIVAASAKESRTFYGKQFVEGQAVTAPDCWSNDGNAPDPKAENPQAVRCLDCKQNIAGSGANNSRACKYSRRVAVLLENDQKGEVFQLTIPSNSLWNSEGGKLGIRPYAEFLGSHGLSITQVVTEMRFDTASSSPKLSFKALRPLEVDEITLVQQRSKSSEALRAIGATAAELDGAKLAAPKAVAPVAPVAAVQSEVIPEPEVKEPVKREKAQAATPKDVSAILDDWGTN
jgi:hypothetical protein